MKKELIFVMIISFIFLSSFSYADNSEGKITGSASSASINASISVLNIGPQIYIYSPLQDRIYRNESILLNYSLLDPDGISLAWYNINGTNISLGNSTAGYLYFNTSEGSKILYLFANDTFGALNYTHVDFIVNNSRIIVIYENFRGAKRGDSIDFDSKSDNELENLSGMILENVDYGKILWNEPINLTADENPDDKIISIDNNVIIGENFIFVNQTSLLNLNKNATLWFYNLSFDDPRILVDGVPCPLTVCSGEQYFFGILHVNVTGFSNYSVEETPEENKTRDHGGGGGIGRLSSKKDFSLDKEKISVSLKQGETKKQSFTITSLTNEKIKLNLSVVGINEFLKLSENEFELLPEESKTIILDFLAREDTIPDLYVGKIITKGDGIEKEILVAIEIESEAPLFDVKVEIPKLFQQILPGEEVLANIKLFRIEGKGNVDVKVEYFIKDEQDKVIIFDEETLAVETQTSFVKEFQLPENIKPGQYIVYVKANYDHQFGSASAWFMVKRKNFLEGNILYFVIGVIIIIIVLILITFHELRSLKKHINFKINDNVLAISTRERIIKSVKNHKSR